MSNFELIIERNIEERQTVLFEMEKVLFTKRYNLSKKHIDIFSVQSVAMIYSIWEGFIQTAFNLYIDEINNKEQKPSFIKNELFIYHIESTFKQFNEYPSKLNQKVGFISKLKDFFYLDRFKLNSGINTQSNVGFDVLNNLLKTFCLELFEEQWGQYKYPNTNLKESLSAFLKYRNGVSHGGDIRSEEKITQQVYIKFRNLVLDLMYAIQTKMVDGIEESRYLKD